MSDEYGRLRRFYRDISGASIVAAGDTAKTLVGVRNASHSIFVQTMGLRLTSADVNRTWNVGDAAGVSATGEVDLTTAPLSLPFDFGPAGLRLSQGQNFSLSLLSRLRAAILAKNPLAYWPCDDAPGLTLADASGHNKTATFAPDASGVTFGVAGAAGDGRTGIRLAGTEQLASFAPVAVTSGFSVAGIITIPSTIVDGSSGALLTDGDQLDGIFTERTGAAYGLGIPGGSGIALTPDVPHHFAITVAAATFAAIGYVDGVALGTLTNWALPTFSFDRLFGDTFADDSTNAALVQHPAIFGTVLSAADVAAMAALLTGASPSGVIAWEGYEKLTATIAAGAGSD